MYSVRFLTMKSVCVAAAPTGTEAGNCTAAATEHKLTICSIKSFHNGHSLTQGNVGKPLNTTEDKLMQTPNRYSV